MHFMNKLLGRNNVLGKVQWPDPKDIETMNNKNWFTPDIMMLERSEHQWLFVPDEVRVNRSHHSLIEGSSRRLFTAFTVENFHFFEKMSDHLPFCLKHKRPDDIFIDPKMLKLAPPMKIQGEVCLVKSEVFGKKLDEYKQNGVQFSRERCRLVIPYRRSDEPAWKKSLHFISAYMYVGIPDYWAGLINSGYALKNVDLMTPKSEMKWLPQYYNYQNRQPKDVDTG